MFSQTTAALEKFDNQHDFERMCADILNATGNKDVILVAPRGGSDGGKDITFTTEIGEKGLACVTLRKDIVNKFNEDFRKRKAGEFDIYMLFCSAYLTASQKSNFTHYCRKNLQAKFVPKDIETLRSLLDSKLLFIREKYLGNFSYISLAPETAETIVDAIVKPGFIRQILQSDTTGTDLNDQLKACSVRILKDKNIVVGAGFLASQKHVITCAQVVIAALDIKQDIYKTPTSQVQLDFPLIAPESWLTARVIFWHPTQVSPSATEEGEDIAILELEMSCPDSAQPAHPIIINNFWKHSFRAFGFPENHMEGIWIEGKLQANRADGRIQIKDLNVPGFFAERGVSGSPVWDEVADGIIGMISSAETDKSKKTAFVIPTSLIVKVWPELSQYVNDDLKNYLEKLHARLSKPPEYYPKDFNFDFGSIHQRVEVSQKRLRYQKEEVHAREAARRAGYYADTEEIRQKQLEQAYQWRGVAMLEQQKNEPNVEDWEKVRRCLKKAIVLGDPGFGKSWLLRYEGRRAAETQLALLQKDQYKRDQIALPIHMRLGTLAEQLTKSDFDIYEAIVRVLQKEYALHERFLPFVRRQLQSSHCFLLLDALDEVAEDKRTVLLEALGKLAEDTRNHILLTSRIVGYSGAPFALRENEQEVELVGFDRKQMSSFIKAWFVKDKEREKWLQETLKNEPILRSLARIPLLLSFICLIGSEDKDIPSRPAKLYKTVLHRLLEGRWRDTRMREPYEGRVADKLAVLERIAWHFATTDEQWRDHLPPMELNQVIRKLCLEEHLIEINSYTLLKELSEKDGILVKAGEPGFSLTESEVPYLFLHRTFHEYLVAQYLAKQSLEVWMKIVKQHFWFDPDWEVVIVLLAGCLDDPTPLLEAILDEPNDAFHMMLLLAGHCLVEVKEAMLKEELLERIISGLLVMMDSSSVRDWEPAALILEQLGDLRVVPKLIVALYSDNKYVQSRAAEIFGQINNSQVISGLREVLWDKEMDEHVRRAAAKALAQNDDQHTMKVLLAELKSKNAEIQWQAAKLLGWIGNSQAREALLVALRDKDAKVRAKVAEALGLIGDSQAVIGLLDALRDRDATVRIEAAEALWWISDPKFIPELLTALRDRIWSVRWRATSALGIIGDPQAIPKLIARLKDKIDLVRWTAAGALGAINDPQTIKPLLAIIRATNEDLLMREAAAQALRMKSNQKLSEALLISLRDKNWEVRRAAAIALGQAGNLQAGEKLLLLLQNKQEVPDVIAAVVESLGIIGDSRAVDPLLMMLEDDNDLYRHVAAEALGLIGDPQAADALLKALWDESELVRTSAVKALEQINDQGVVARLLPELWHEDEYIRFKTVDVLEKLIQDNTITTFYMRLLEAWCEEELDDGARVMFYTLLQRLAPRLRGVVGDQWTGWRKLLIHPTKYMLYLRLLEQEPNNNIPELSIAKYRLVLMIGKIFLEH